MSKVLFYTSTMADKVSQFMESIQNDPEKANRFITFDKMASRTKVTLESSASEIVSSIITFASLINDVNIFVPWMGLIRGSLKEYIDIHGIENVTYQIIVDENEEVPSILSGESYSEVIRVPSESPIEYELFNPAAKRIMYIMKLSEVSKLVENISENSIISFSGLDDIRSVCGIKQEEQVGIAVPQLQVGSWIEMSAILENLIVTSPIDYLYLEMDEDEQKDFYTKLVLKLIDTDSISIVYGKRNFIIDEKPQEDTSTTYEPEEIPSVDAEIVSE